MTYLALGVRVIGVVGVIIVSLGALGAALARASGGARRVRVIVVVSLGAALAL